jgi:GNAT superfamily N-acetyltransferase
LWGRLSCSIRGLPMEQIAVYMVRDDVESIPQHELPEGFSCRTFEDGDRETWAQVCFESGLFETIEKARETFDKDFAGHEDELRERCFFVVDESTGKAVGTTTAWYDINWKDTGLDYGRIHWVGIRKDYQGRKLSKPMLTEAMRFIAAHHGQARLATNTGCVRAIGIYLDFGFEPDLTTDKWEEAWAHIAREGKHPKLERFLSENGAVV